MSAVVVGVMLILVGVALLGLEFNLPGWGGPGALGIVVTIAGVLVLLDAAGAFDFSRAMIIALCVVGAVFVPVATVLVARARRLPDSVNPTSIGLEGVALTDINPFGSVRVRSEEWSAESRVGKIEAGARVRVVDEDGLRLTVERS